MQIIGRSKQRLDDEVPDVHVAEVQVLGMERWRIEESIGLLPGNGGIGHITRVPRGLRGIYRDAGLQAIHPAFGPGTPSTGSLRAPRQVGWRDVEEGV